MVLWSFFHWLTHRSGKEFKELFHDWRCCYCRGIFSAPPFPLPDPTWSCRFSWTSSLEFTQPHCQLGRLTYLIKNNFFLPCRLIFRKTTELIWFAEQPWSLTQTSGLMKRAMEPEGQSFHRLSSFKTYFLLKYIFT